MNSGPRIAAIGVLAAFLAIVATFLAIALFGPKDPDIGIREDAGDLAIFEERDDGVAFRGTAGDWGVEGRVTFDSSRSFRLRIAVADRSGQAAPSWVQPRLQFHMTEHVMDAVTSPVVDLGTGRYQADGKLPMEGRWRMRIGLPGGVLAFAVNVRGQ